MKRIFNIEIAAAFIVSAVLFVISVVWGGFAQTAAGLTIPDTPLTLPFLTVFAFTVAQAALFGRGLILPLAICLAAKTIILAFLLFVLCGYALGASYIAANAHGSFYDNATFTALVIAFIVTSGVSLVLETILLVAHAKRS